MEQIYEKKVTLWIEPIIRNKDTGEIHIRPIAKKLLYDDWPPNKHRKQRPEKNKSL